MTRAKRKESELIRFGLFQKRTGLLSDGEPTQPDPPEPDICVTVHDARFGIEMTELVTNKHLRAQESEQDGIVASAQCLYEEQGLPCVGAEFHWKEAQAISKAQRRQLSPYLAKLVASHVPVLGEEVILDPTPDATEHFEHPLFDRIWLNRIVEHEENLWDSPRSWWVPNLVPEVIQARIDDKNSGPAHYRQRYLERWLLITSDGAAPSSGFDLTSTVLTHVYSTSFDRVFLAVFAMGGVHELKVSRS